MPAKPQKVAKQAAAKRSPILLSGGNPQIAKADGDAPVQAYIAAMPGGKRAVGRRLDSLVPLHPCLHEILEVAFFRGASLRPVPPGASKQKDVRYLDVHEDGELDEARVIAWVKQASRLPGWGKARGPVVRALVSLMMVPLVAVGSAYASAEEATTHWHVQKPAQIEWRVADSLPPGAEIAVIEGDPSTAGFFTMRIRMPDGYRVPPHWHAQQERVTVLSGVLNLGHGDTFDAKKTKALGAGTYSSMPPRMTHFGWMTGETVLQLSTLGPWSITYVDPADDPRKKTD